MKYLGLSLGASLRAKSIWDDIVEKIEQTFGWMEDAIFVKGGRVTLIKNTLSNLPSYFRSLFPLSDGVANRKEKFQQDFFVRWHQ